MTSLGAESLNPPSPIVERFYSIVSLNATTAFTRRSPVNAVLEFNDTMEKDNSMLSRLCAVGFAAC